MLYSKRPFYFYLDEFKNASIKNNLILFNKVIKINNFSISQLKKMDKINELNDEANLFQKTIYLNLKNQEWLTNYFLKEKVLNNWVLKEKDLNKQTNECITKNIIPVKQKNRLMDMNKLFHLKINSLKKTTLHLKQFINNLQIEIDDLLEKTSNFLNRSNIVQEGLLNENYKNFLKQGNKIQEDLLKEKYSNLKEKFSVLERTYSNFFITKFGNIYNNLSYTNRMIEIKLKMLTIKNIKYSNSQQILDQIQETSWTDYDDAMINHSLDLLDSSIDDSASVQKFSDDDLLSLLDLPSTSSQQETSWTDYDDAMINHSLDLLDSLNNESSTFLLNQIINNPTLETIEIEEELNF